MVRAYPTKEMNSGGGEGISDSTLHRIEMAEQNVTLKTLEQLCQRLKCAVEDLVGE